MQPVTTLDSWGRWQWFVRRPGSGLLEGHAVVSPQAGQRFTRRPGSSLRRGLLEGQALVCSKDGQGRQKKNVPRGLAETHLPPTLPTLRVGYGGGWLHERLCGPSLCGYSGSFRVRSQSGPQTCQKYGRHSRNSPQVSGALPGNRPQLHGLDSGSST